MKKMKILFLCTHNSARSQMAEAILKHHKSNTHFEAYSAGSEPALRINPLAVKAMQEVGIDISANKPKLMTDLLEEDFDFVITVCDKMKEKCPVYPGQPVYAHWGSADPSDAKGDDAQKLKFTEEIRNEIASRINRFLNLPFEKLERAALEQHVISIGEATLEEI